MNKKRLILLIIISIGVWYFWGRGQKANGPEQPAPEAKVEESVTTEPPATSSGNNVVGEGKARVHYFTKEALASCSTVTTAVEQTVDPKYGHRAAGALVTMTLPMPKEISNQYVSALVPGTRLLTMRISDAGVAIADYNSALDDAIAPCVKAQRRAQIEATLKEFAEIKGVAITVGGVGWE